MGKQALIRYKIHMNENIEWKVANGLVEYNFAIDFMENRVADIRNGNAPECVWLLQHPALYTGGTSAKPADLLTPERFPVFETGRGGQYTYHGPGQRICYVMLDLKARTPDIRKYVRDLEQWIINSLGIINSQTNIEINGQRRDGRVGIWVDRGNGFEDKIAAIGVRLRKWVAFHGIAINVNPILEHFNGIVPCGIENDKFGVTSLVDMGISITMQEVDIILKAEFEKIFN